MRCPDCSTDNSEQAVYCTGCGRNLVRPGFDSRPKYDGMQESEWKVDSKEIDDFGRVYWSDDLWMWQIGIFIFTALIVVGVLALVFGLSAMDVWLTAMGCAFLASSVAVLLAIRAHPRAAGYSSALLGPYRLGESEAHEVREVYEKMTSRPPRR